MVRGSSEKMKMKIEAPESTTGPRRRPPHCSAVFSRATLPPPRSAFAAPSRRLRFSPPSSTSTLPHGRLATSPTPTPRSEPTKKIIVSAVASRSGGCRERGLLGRPLAFSFVWIDVKWDWLWTGQDKKEEKEASMASISNLPLTVQALV